MSTLSFSGTVPAALRVMLAFTKSKKPSMVPSRQRSMNSWPPSGARATATKSSPWQGPAFAGISSLAARRLRFCVNPIPDGGRKRGAGGRNHHRGNHKRCDTHIWSNSPANPERIDGRGGKHPHDREIQQNSEREARGDPVVVRLVARRG